MAKKSSGVDIADKDAHAVLSSNVHVGALSDISKLWAYDGQMNRSPKWEQMNPNKHILGGILEACNGEPLKQVVWFGQMKSFFKTLPNATYTEVELENAAYRMRVMLSNLRDTKRRGKQPPRRFQHLSYLLAKIKISDETSCASTPSPKKPPTSPETPTPTSPLVVALAAVAGHDDLDVVEIASQSSDDLFEQLFPDSKNHPSQVRDRLSDVRQGADVLGVAAFAGEQVRQGADVPGVAADDVEELLKLMPSGPLPTNCWRKRKAASGENGPMKRPASAKPGVVAGSDDGVEVAGGEAGAGGEAAEGEAAEGEAGAPEAFDDCLAEGNTNKKYSSRYYHRAYKAATRAGRIPERAKHEARLAHHNACTEWDEKHRIV